MADTAIKADRNFKTPPEERIWRLMENVMDAGLARFDLAFWHWAQSDSKAKEVFERVLNKRFDYVAQTFRQTGFSKSQAKARARLMVVCMMGESTLISEKPGKRNRLHKLEHEILVNKGGQYPFNCCRLSIEINSQ